ncbi:conserved hypothetical protein [Magnetospirillum sp. LM-5]|uniref:class I SAM-dependent methyltransferase n=1 Tax=Magnetospirillum sp. LM-5 TaxID=2681466 RepID=UPI0013859CE4|nr:class I SAM-dependent methyltransferase [Magnetospirillum sp. LM-5]CAA7619100.1 conserved hypothetical protein [Magnetospirillum sp. LM-5]
MRIVSKLFRRLQSFRKRLGVEKRLSMLEAQVEYLEYELSRNVSLLRYLSAPVINDLPYARQTRSSFDFQWDLLPPGRYNLDNEEFRKDAAGYVCQFTGLPAEWFQGKKVIDVGCGAGRYSWAMSTMGAEVLSVDQSKHGLERCAMACADYPTHRTRQIDLLQPFDINEQFDLVWSFGVLHHTGDTYGAFSRVHPLVKPGGYIFMMIYGEPRQGYIDDYRAVAEYECWRRKTRNMGLSERLDAVNEAMAQQKFLVNGPLHIEGYFDAISPLVADLYSFAEIESWLIEAGFCDIRQTVDTRNLHISARKV